ncbi:hypothetical protein HORIV_45500 [Vreelandella olivaria]|uniref:Uncharacterized protein n=1 Tax=Vreelandella olivaria TaxID=390919 RepID=A0ABN5WYR4_9GAMM|nr:hypothetical protein HORIV_45500 [Halomonas olivaria]
MHRTCQWLRTCHTAPLARGGKGFPPLKAVCEQSATWHPDARQGYAYKGGSQQHMGA